VSRKLAKQTVLLFAIIAAVLIIPSAGFGEKTIQTTQRIIVIDPGHGGTRNGLVTSGGLQEKNIALKLALKTARKLEDRYNVLLTRNRDTNMSSRDRIFFANKNSADLFVCIHLHHSAKPSGFFYYFSPPKNHSRTIAAGENTWKSQPLIHLSESKKAIDSFLTIFSTNKKPNYFFSDSAPIIMLEGSTMPAILIEPLSISLLPQHPDEIENILEEYALLIAESIDLYFRKK